MNRSGLTDVAQKAGVSIATASRVLNGTQVAVPISERTRHKVQKAALALGYRPSAAARALRTGLTHTFGVFGNGPEAFWMWSEGDGFPSEMMRGMMRSAIDHGFHMTLLTGAEVAGQTGAMPDLGIVDGILVLNRDLSQSPHIVDVLASSGKPVVYLLDYPTSDCQALAPDDVQAAYLAVQTLLEKGHEHIGFVRTNNWHGIFGRRITGWQRGLADVGIVAKDDWCVDVTQLDLKFLQAQGVTALVCANSSIARRVCDLAEADRVPVPRDLSVLPIVHETLGKGPKDLAGIVFPIAQIVQEGTDLLIRMIQGEDVAPQVRLFECYYDEGPTISHKGV